MMAGVAHNPGFAKKVGVPQKVGKEFNKADKGTGMLGKSKPLIAKAPMGDNRAGRLKDFQSDRGVFRMKSNRLGE